MRRLIDADKSKTDLEKAISKNEDMDCLDFLRAASVIDAQPTAYDPDKVVEQLEAVSYERYGNEGMGGELVVNLDDAITIVKDGKEIKGNITTPTDMIDGILGRIIKGREAALEAALLRHGFSRDYIRCNKKEFRVEERAEGRFYYHDGELMFNEIECVIYKPLKKSVNSVTNELAYRVMYVHY